MPRVTVGGRQAEHELQGESMEEDDMVMRVGSSLGKRERRTDEESKEGLVSFPDLLAKAYLAKTLTAFGKTFVRRSSTRFGFLLIPRGVIGPIYTYFKLNYLNFHNSLSYS